MLDKIAHEVVLAISSLLVLKDKVILMRTCRHLYNLISSTNLYSELDLFSRNERTADTITKFKDNPSFGTQVRLLSMDLQYISDALLLQIPTIFPNITRFKIGLFLDGYMEYRYPYFKEPILQWSNTLEMFDMRYDYLGILPALKIVTFPHLTYLMLGEYCHFKDKSEGFDFYYFLPAIKNAPSLKWLMLRRCAVNLELLEEIHVSCPYLKSLTLYLTSIVVRNDTLFQPIIPANSLVYLEVTSPYCFDRNGLFLDYITTKYRCLKKLVLDLDVERVNHLDFSQYYKRVDIHDSDTSNSENQQDPIVQEYIQVFRSLIDENDETIAVYEKSGTRFFSNLTTTVKSLTIEEDIFNNTIEALATSDIKLDNFHYESTVDDPDQIQYISHIRSIKEMHIVILAPRKMDLQVLPYNSIIKLDLRNMSEAVYLDWLLSSFPLLEELTLGEGNHWTISDNFSSHSAIIFPNLWNFHICVNSIDQKCFDFLASNVPNIKMFSIFCIARMPGLCDVDISRWELKQLRLEFCDMEFNGNYYYNIKTPSLDEIIMYNKKNGSVKLLENSVYSVYDTKLPMINIISGDGNQFQLYCYNVSLNQSKITLTPSI